MTWEPDEPWRPEPSAYEGVDARLQRLIDALGRAAIAFAELARKADEIAESLRREMEAK